MTYIALVFIEFIKKKVIFKDEKGTNRLKILRVATLNKSITTETEVWYYYTFINMINLSLWLCHYNKHYTILASYFKISNSIVWYVCMSVRPYHYNKHYTTLASYFKLSNSIVWYVYMSVCPYHYNKHYTTLASYFKLSNSIVWYVCMSV